MIFDTLLQIANSSLPVINIPAIFTPIIGNAVTTGANTFDPTSIAGILGLATAAFAYYKNRHDTNVTENRTVALSNAQLSLSDSLKATDTGVQQSAIAMNALVQKLAEHPDLNKLLTDTSVDGLDNKCLLEYIKGQSEEWQKSIKEYYQNQPRVSGEYSKDPVVEQTADVLKQTTPTPSP